MSTETIILHGVEAKSGTLLSEAINAAKEVGYDNLQRSEKFLGCQKTTMSLAHDTAEPVKSCLSHIFDSKAQRVAQSTESSLHLST